MTIKTNPIYPFAKNQRGFVLITSLVFLAMLTLLGVTALDSTNLDEKMTRNARTQAAAKQASESTLRDAENFIENTVSFATGLESALTPGQFDNIQSEFDPLIPANWVVASTKPATSPSAYTTPANPSQYVFTFVRNKVSEESLNANLGGYNQPTIGVPPISYFKVTARGAAGSNTQSVLQIYYAKRLNDQ